MKKAIVFAALCAMFSSGFAAPLWQNLTDKNWVSGPKYREADLVGNVVCVFYWQPGRENVDKILPRVEALWNAFKTKHCVFVSSVSGNPDEAKKSIKEHKLTFSVYEKLRKADAQSAPRFGFCVLNARGKVLYGGPGDRAATEALVNALGEAAMPYALLGDMELDRKSKYRNLEKSLVLGKPLKNIVRKLRGDVKRGEAKSASSALKSRLPRRGSSFPRLTLRKPR